MLYICMILMNSVFCAHTCEIGTEESVHGALMEKNWKNVFALP